MIIADAEPNDIVNASLRSEALRAQSKGEGFSIWHGSDTFTGEDVEVYINLDRKAGAVALEGKVYPAHVGEKQHLLILAFTDSSRGEVDLDLDGEIFPMDRKRVGIEVYTGVRNKTHGLRLFDRLTKQNILELDGDHLSQLVESGDIDPKDLHTSALAYAHAVGLV